jgi:hypothetical protein
MSTRSESPELLEPIPSQSKHHGSGRSWAKEETALLEKHCEEYREASETAHSNIVSDVLQELLDIIQNGRMFKKEERTALKKVSAILWWPSSWLNLLNLGYQSLVWP